MKKVSIDTKLTVVTTFFVVVGFVVNNLLGYFFIPKGMAFAILNCSLWILRYICIKTQMRALYN